jgi:hypothetical protein
MPEMRGLVDRVPFTTDHGQTAEEHLTEVDETEVY